MGRQGDSRRRRRASGLTEEDPTVTTIASVTEPTTTLLKLSSVSVAVRWSPRLGRHRSRCRPRRAVGDSRPERGRQDHAVQRGGRRYQADGRPGLDQGRRLHVAAVTSPAEPRSRPHLSANSALRRPHGGRQSVPCPRRHARSASIDAAHLARRAVADQGSRRRQNRVARRPCRVTTSATFPTANNANSRWPWRWSPTPT